jgi:beta-lactam-binding protein with PASTA domain
VIGLTRATAETALTSAGFVLGTVTTASSPTVADGSISRSDPSAGAEVNPGSSVNLEVSSGPAQVAVPDVAGFTRAAAETTLTGAGLAVGTTTAANSPTVAAGNIIRTNPIAGTLVNPGSSMNLEVSSGPASVAVPDVAGFTRAAAETALTGAGLAVGTTTAANSPTIPAGNIIRTDPIAGTLVNPGSSVNLEVSSGPAQVTVPNVVGLTQAAAEAALRSAGLALGTVTTVQSPVVPAGGVSSSNPRAGDLVNQASKVDLEVSIGQRAHWWQPILPYIPGALFDVIVLILLGTIIWGISGQGFLTNLGNYQVDVARDRL